MSLLKGLLILFVFKEPGLNSLILRIVFLVSMSFNSALITGISFFVLALGYLCCCTQVLVGVGLSCLFEMFLLFLGRPVSL